MERDRQQERQWKEHRSTWQAHQQKHYLERLKVCLAPPPLDRESLKVAEEMAIDICKRLEHLSRQK